MMKRTLGGTLQVMISTWLARIDGEGTVSQRGLDGTEIDPDYLHC